MDERERGQFVKNEHSVGESGDEEIGVLLEGGRSHVDVRLKRTAGHVLQLGSERKEK